MSMLLKDRPLAAPSVSPEIRPFFDAAAQGRFLVKHCRPCGKAHWYPRAICPFCGSEETYWRDSAGTGHIHAFSVMERADPPFALAYVVLDEGPMMITNIVDCKVDDLAIDLPVRVVFKSVDDAIWLPLFTPDR